MARPHNTKRRTEKADPAGTRRPWKLPEWLPKVVAEFTAAIAAGRYLPLRLTRPLRLRLRRLTTDSRMQFVWRQLAREVAHVSQGEGLPRIHKDHISAFADAALRGYLIAATTGDSRATYWRRAPTAKQQRELMQKIRGHARELRNLLGDPLDFHNWAAWDKLSEAIRLYRDENTPLQKLLIHLARETHGRHWQGQGAIATPEQAIPPPGPLEFPPEARVLLGDLRLQLAALECLSELSLDPSRAQTKPPYKTKQLRQAVYVRAVSTYLNSQGVRPRQPRARS